MTETPSRPIVAFGDGLATILVIDRNRKSLETLGHRLTQFGYRTVLSDTGPGALGLIAGRGFDLVLLDMAPHVHSTVSGVQILHEIRGDHASADLPVIMLTGPGESAEAVAALAAGADDHVAKPFDPDLLAARIASVLARARRIAELKRANAALDARVALRAMELGEANSALARTRADHQRLIASVRTLSAQVERLSETSVSR